MATQTADWLTEHNEHPSLDTSSTASSVRYVLHRPKANTWATHALRIKSKVGLLHVYSGCCLPAPTLKGTDLALLLCFALLSPLAMIVLLSILGHRAQGTSYLTDNVSHKQTHQSSSKHWRPKLSNSEGRISRGGAQDDTLLCTTSHQDLFSFSHILYIYIYRSCSPKWQWVLRAVTITSNQVTVKVTLRVAVGPSVSLSAYRVPLGAYDQITVYVLSTTLCRFRGALSRECRSVCLSVCSISLVFVRYAQTRTLLVLLHSSYSQYTRQEDLRQSSRYSRSCLILLGSAPEPSRARPPSSLGPQYFLCWASALSNAPNVPIQTILHDFCLHILWRNHKPASIYTFSRWHNGDERL